MAIRSLVRLSALFVIAALVATAAWTAATVLVRPLDGVEGDVLFEAMRARARLPLYVDPAAGARDYGSIPARYLVLYTPIWPEILAALSRAAPAGDGVRALASIGRIASSAAWFGLLGLIAWRAPRERRRAALAASAFVAGSFVLALYGTSARPDAVAVLAAGLALERSARRAEVDAMSGVLFAAAAWLKPNVVGLAPGAIVAGLLVARRASLRGLGAAIATSALAAGALTLAYGGVWIEHLLASTGQGLSFRQWTDQIASRGPFFSLPIAAAIAVGWRSRRDPGAAIATGALVSSALWCALCLAKIGSASNYFLEPLVAVVVVVARAAVPALGPRASVAAAALAALQTAWDGVASVRSAVEEAPRAYARRSAIERAGALCGRSRGEGVVLADEPGLELMANGRVVETPFQSTHLARRGRFPVQAWIADVTSPDATCLLMQDDLLERPLARVDLEHDRFGPELRRALGARFELAREEAGIRVYRPRPPVLEER